MKGSFDTPGPGVDWIRVKVPLVDDEPLSPLGRACAVADFGNGISGLMPGTHNYINPDLTVYLHRYPEGARGAATRVSTHEPRHRSRYTKKNRSRPAAGRKSPMFSSRHARARRRPR